MTDGGKLNPQPLRVRSLLQRIGSLVLRGNWQRLSCGVGSKGLCEYDWVWIELVSQQQVGWSRWLLVCRKLSNPT
ncbi:hypothetical protein [Chlorogloea sp. CCALA 695]|uniref:hypothetical protein n=1 Tax=Chlorogloea sp. CCALA 695 TaxID=2107693 RepID=UPI0011B20A6B|nr:hypothetical protein [Chlorogloea sp. CCALA 695]